VRKVPVTITVLKLNQPPYATAQRAPPRSSTFMLVVTNQSQFYGGQRTKEGMPHDKTRI
jgi:hypothetical protein